MEFPKRDMWKLFYAIALLSLGFIVIISYVLWSMKLSDYTSKQQSKVDSTAYYIEDLFLQYETILDIVGRNIIDFHGNIKKDPHFLDQILSMNPSLACFRIYSPSGDIVTASSNVDTKAVLNIMQTHKKESFLETLLVDGMVLGRTTYFPSLHSLIIPLRKAIRGADGKVIAVVASGLKLNKESKFVATLLQRNRISLIKGESYYFQFYDFDLKHYIEPLSKEYIDTMRKLIEQTANEPIEKIKAKEQIITLRAPAYISNEMSLLSLKYISRYNLWVASSLPMSVIKNDFLEEELFILVVYVLIMFVIYYLVQVIDKNEIQKEKTLKEQALCDSLTKLHNRLYLEERIEQLEQYTLFFVDLDGFKNVNDSFGHEYGDRVLNVIAKRFKQITEGKEYEIIRYSGDEFIFVTELMNQKAIEQFASQILHVAAKEIVLDEFRLFLGASIGVASYPKDGKNFDEIKRYADLAMYKAKEIKNSFVIFHHKLHREYLQHATLERELKTALERDEFYLVYQPQVYSDGELHGVETLIRWRNETLGDVPPSLFIPVAESTGLIKEIGRFVLERAVAEMDALMQKIGKTFYVSVNISAKQLAQHDFTHCIMEKIANAATCRKHLVLEITETAFVEDSKHALELLRMLKEQGVAISLDDFGTGYSSMSMLQNLPVDELKIDKSFIDEVESRINTRQIVYSIVIIAKSLGMKIVAEGVESATQKEILDEMGCDIYQGYLFARPMKSETLQTVLEENGGVFISRFE